MIWLEWWSVLGVMKVDVYAIVLGTAAKGCRRIDGEYLFHFALADG